MTYRRKESRSKETWGMIFTAVAMASMGGLTGWQFGKDALLGSDRIDWLMAPQVLSFVASSGVFSIGAFAMAIWPRWTRPVVSERRSPADPQRLEEVRLAGHMDSAPAVSLICFALAALFAVSFLSGIAALFRSPPEFKLAFTGLGLGALFGTVFGAAGLNLHRIAHEPPFVAIHRQGVRFGPRKPRTVSWLEMKEIRVRPKDEQEADPEEDEIAFILRNGAVGPRKQNYLISPMTEFGLEPSKVLAIIEQFRPSNVPIHDPRRIVDEDGAAKPETA